MNPFDARRRVLLGAIRCNRTTPWSTRSRNAPDFRALRLSLFAVTTKVASMLTERDLAVLKSIAHYYTVTRAQVTQLHFPGDKDGRATRKRLNTLLDLKFVDRTNMQVCNPSMGHPAPVFFPTRDGVAFLAEQTGDDSWHSVATQSPNWQHLYHFVTIADQHMLIDQAAELINGLKIATWHSEYSVLNPFENDPEKRFTLYSLLSVEPRLVCKPDAGFELVMEGFRKVFYLETDRDTTKNADRVASQKCRGYVGMLATARHKQHFPAAHMEGFTVLIIAPSVTRRESLRKAFAEKPGAKLYKFASRTELTPEVFLRDQFGELQQEKSFRY